MKTMETLDGKRILRVSDEKAAELYHDMEAKYIPKSEWKEKVRDVKKEPVVNKDTDEVEMVTKKSNKMSKSAKRHLRKSKKQ